MSTPYHAARDRGVGFRKPQTLAAEIARHLREREALRILEAEGLVTLEPHRGAHVRTLSADELREIFDGAVDEVSAHITGLKDTLLERRPGG